MLGRKVGNKDSHCVIQALDQAVTQAAKGIVSSLDLGSRL
jgi:ABC-type uncharacterized transport system auxiliary subunit